jgi:hypothetical protein
MIGDLHVELIFLYNKLSVRLLEYGETLNPSLGNFNSKLELTIKKLYFFLRSDINFEKNFEQLLKECKKNKISQSLLYLSKALYLNSSPTGKYSKQQKELIEVMMATLLKPLVSKLYHFRKLINAS